MSQECSSRMKDFTCRTWGLSMTWLMESNHKNTSRKRDRQERLKKSRMNYVSDQTLHILGFAQNGVRENSIQFLLIILFSLVIEKKEVSGHSPTALHPHVQCLHFLLYYKCYGRVSLVTFLAEKKIFQIFIYSQLLLRSRFLCNY